MTPAELHRWAHPFILQALEANGLGGEPDSVALAVHGVGWLETRYGTAWQWAGKGSNNWGAIQYGRAPCNPDVSFQYTDSSPNADGTSTRYTICFKRYAGPKQGATDLVHVALIKRPSVLAAARRGDYFAVSAELHRTVYYEGFGKTVADRIANHYRAFSSSVAAASAALDLEQITMQPPRPEPWQDDVLEDNPLLLPGMRGPYVKVWQGVLNELLSAGEVHGFAALALDGVFGKLTGQASKLAQMQLGLKADGKIGPLTWGRAAKVLEGDENTSPETPEAKG